MFVDEVKIYVKGGDGGRGCLSFSHFKHNPRAGPDGGDGGNGGSIIMESSRGKNTLLDLRYSPHKIAKRGQHGKGKNQYGRTGDDLMIKVPVGTVVKDVETGQILADLTVEGQRVVIACGGRGGRGNTRFKSSTNQAPRTVEDGSEGEERWLHLELKLIADVGLIGYPNAGKSTLLSRISSAHPKIGDYPFTSLHPTVGVVQAGDFDTFVAADLPGLIKGAHLGKGLGVRFLRHIERTDLLVHLVDMSEEKGGDPLQRFHEINDELNSFSIALGEKEQIAVATKMDVFNGEERCLKLEEGLKEEGIPVFPISSVTGFGLNKLIYAIMSRLKTLRNAEIEGL